MVLTTMVPRLERAGVSDAMLHRILVAAHPIPSRLGESIAGTETDR